MEKDFYCDIILKDKVEIKKIIETENILAYYHTNPSWPLHIVVITKEHFESLIDIPSNSKLLAEMFEVLNKIITKTTEKHGGCRLTTNFGHLQETKHLHWHIYIGDM